MKTLLTLLLVCAAISITAQSFTLITDPNNAIVIKPDDGGSWIGCSWIDVDNDNDLDLFYSGYLFINDGNGGFTEPESGITNNGLPILLSGNSWADLGNDGDLDVIFSSADGTRLTRIFENDGSGNFIKFNSVLDSIDASTWSVQWSDYNNDTYPDIMLTFANNFLNPSHFPNRLYNGNEDLLFSPISESYEFLNDLHPYTVSYFTDFDLDGDQDLFIASGPGGSPGLDFMYRNLLTETGEATFEKITDLPFSTQMQDGQCYNFIDYDNDGDLDMCLTNWGGADNRFYVNNDGVYESDITLPFIFNATNLTNAWGDMDNDGDLDVLVTASNGGNGVTSGSGYFINNGDGTFTQDQSNYINTTMSGSSSGLTIGDYDNDGDLDFFTVGKKKGLFRNDLANENNYVSFNLIGNASNKAAIGARVKAKATINNQTVWQTREVTAQNTFMGQNSLRVHFGLGDATLIEELIIIWPSGNEDTYSNITSNNFYHVEEGVGIDEIATGIDELSTPIQFDIFPNPAKDYVIIRFSDSHQGKINTRIIDLQGKMVFEKSYAPLKEISISTQNLIAGEYLVMIETNDQRSSKKIIIYD